MFLNSLCCAIDLRLHIDSNKNIPLGLYFAVCSLRWAVLLREGLQLERVKGIFPTSHVLHSVLPPAALTVVSRGTEEQHTVISTDKQHPNNSSKNFLHAVVPPIVILHCSIKCITLGYVHREGGGGTHTQWTQRNKSLN